MSSSCTKVMRMLKTPRERYEAKKLMARNRRDRAQLARRALEQSIVCWYKRIEDLEDLIRAARARLAAIDAVAEAD